MNEDVITTIIGPGQPSSQSIAGHTKWLWPPQEKQLCDRCKQYSLGFTELAIKWNVSQVKQGAAATCGLCGLVWEVWRKFKDTNSLDDREWILCNLSSSLLFVNDAPRVPIMSILRSPDCNLPMKNIQVGLPRLPNLQDSDDETLNVEEKVLFEIIHGWLRHCDDKHPHCKPENPKLPTRLLYVGTTKKPALRITESEDIDISRGLPRYIALSHPWGDRERYPPFETSMDDYETYKTVGIEFDKLTQTFKHAVKAARAFEIEYLWIDSICIIQGAGGDWAAQAGLMETVYSSAYFVLAASRATSQHSGFLGKREERGFTCIPQASGGSLYFCEFADDFKTHVLDSYHATRGWVLQERALARRTVYFSKAQAYWECGDGIRCETMTTMHNSLVAFLGDPSYPGRAVGNRNYGEKITLYQELFKSYTRLGLSYPTDRPKAIKGLEYRLRTNFQVQGRWGILDSPGDSMLHRSLLWHKGQETSILTDIDFKAEKFDTVPSWSWMSRAAPLMPKKVDKSKVDPCWTMEYVRIEGGETEWVDSVRPPWRPREDVSDQQANELVAEAVYFDDPETLQDPQAWLVWDSGENIEPDRRKNMYVVVLGRKVAPVAPTASAGQAVRGAVASGDINKLHYVLIVEPRPTDGQVEPQAEIYKRIGAGVLLGKHLIRKGKTVRIT